mmetsp:Transcript_29072/g.70910  ORF Transcript_29072/g.70910 Transcript_29072/m.70910 type:complete len:444 (-) Transcript_29072:184-1515(-)
MWSPPPPPLNRRVLGRRHRQRHLRLAASLVTVFALLYTVRHPDGRLASQEISGKYSSGSTGTKNPKQAPTKRGANEFRPFGVRTGDEIGLSNIWNKNVTSLGAARTTDAIENANPSDPVIYTADDDHGKGGYPGIKPFLKALKGALAEIHTSSLENSSSQAENGWSLLPKANESSRSDLEYSKKDGSIDVNNERVERKSVGQNEPMFETSVSYPARPKEEAEKQHSLRDPNHIFNGENHTEQYRHSSSSKENCQTGSQVECKSGLLGLLDSDSEFQYFQHSHPRPAEIPSRPGEKARLLQQAERLLENELQNGRPIRMLKRGSNSYGRSRNRSKSSDTHLANKLFPRIVGRVFWYNQIKEYGFVTPEALNSTRERSTSARDVFLRPEQLEPGYVPQPGDRVRFTLANVSGLLYAERVQHLVSMLTGTDCQYSTSIDTHRPTAL